MDPITTLPRPPSPESNSWGARCLALRSRLGLSQRRLAGLLGCGPSTIAQLELGTKPRPPMWLRRLLVVCEIATRSGPPPMDCQEYPSNERRWKALVLWMVGQEDTRDA